MPDLPRQGDLETVIVDKTNQTAAEVITDAGLKELRTHDESVRAKLELGVSVYPQVGTAHPSKLVYDFLKNGAATNMAVNGSVTPQVFIFNASASYDYYIQKITIGLDESSIMSLSGFFSYGTPLTNGCLFEMRLNSVTYQIGVPWKIGQEIANLCDDFFLSNESDYFVGHIVFNEPVHLVKGSADFIKMTIRDSIQLIDGFYMTVKGYRV